jgi:hypothetical protein
MKTPISSLLASFPKPLQEPEKRDCRFCLFSLGNTGNPTVYVIRMALGLHYWIGLPVASYFM